MTTLLPRRYAFAALSLTLVATAIGCKHHGGVAASDGGPGDGSAAVTERPGLPPPPDVAAAPADAIKTASGIASKVLAPGTGTDHPSQNDSVRVNYTGWTTDGKMFDSSVQPRQPMRKA
ncbi:MAG TPA: FKBP-type peptidyl-prolyl cis-trans isomerase, partial [Acidimicrobiales bacterium]|nr:FKBP-type peptidyl-prolyl cis-trans isomerase [Acidimicrobiales bacterium]